jgi:hypothetical protein
MARHVKSRMGWSGRDSNRIVPGTGLLGIVCNILGLNHRVNESASCTTYGGIHDSTAYHGFAVFKEAEVSLRRVQMLQ